MNDLRFILFSVRRAYHKVSLKVHPDRVEEKDKKVATEKFQTLGKVYSILSDEERRKIYNETGKITYKQIYIKNCAFRIFNCKKINFRLLLLKELSKIIV